MRNKRLLVWSIFLAIILIPVLSFATDITEEDTTPRSKRIYLQPEKSVLERGKFKFIASLSEGYDNNTHLDSRRIGDSYTQAFFRSSFSTDFSKKTKGGIDYELMSLMYAGESSLDLVRNGLTASIDHSLTKNLIVTAGYNFDWINYTNTGDDDYLENALGVRIKQILPYKLYHSLGYALSYRNFLERKIRITDNGLPSDKRRNDLRDTVNYEVGKYFTKDLLKASFQYFYNTSSDRYLKYYDYDSFRFGASLTHLFTDKITGYFSFNQQYRGYRSRTLILDPASLEHERTYLYTTALYYNMTKAFSLAMNYTYRQNYSNEPLDNYSGSLISASAYYQF